MREMLFFAFPAQNTLQLPLFLSLIHILGKWITSVTMTIFYVLLYYVWRQRYQIKGKGILTAALSHWFCGIMHSTTRTAASA